MGTIGNRHPADQNNPLVNYGTLSGRGLTRTLFHQTANVVCCVIDGRISDRRIFLLSIPVYLSVTQCSINFVVSSALRLSTIYSGLFIMLYGYLISLSTECCRAIILLSNVAKSFIPEIFANELYGIRMKVSSKVILLSMYRKKLEIYIEIKISL